MKGVENPESFHMNPHKTDLGPVLPGPKVLTTEKLPNVGPWALPKISSVQMEFDVHFPLGNNFQLNFRNVLL